MKQYIVFCETDVLYKPNTLWMDDICFIGICLWNLKTVDNGTKTCQINH